MTARACFCAGCWQTFASMSGFNAHRVGAYLDDPPGYGRRCLPPVELEARGFVLKNDGCWHSPAPATIPGHWRVVAASPQERVPVTPEADAGEGAE